MSTSAVSDTLVARIQDGEERIAERGDAGSHLIKLAPALETLRVNADVNAPVYGHGRYHRQRRHHDRHGGRALPKWSASIVLGIS
jgi:hypothetical protein